MFVNLNGFVVAISDTKRSLVCVQQWYYDFVIYQ